MASLWPGGNRRQTDAEIHDALNSSNQQTIGEPASRYGRGNGQNPLLLHQKL